MSILYVLSFNENKEPQLIKFDKFINSIGIKKFSITTTCSLDDLEEIKEFSPGLKVSPLFRDWCAGTVISNGRIFHELEDIATGFAEDGYYDLNGGTLHSVDVYTLKDEIINISYDENSTTYDNSFYSERLLVESYGLVYRDIYPLGLNLITLWQEPKVEVENV